MKTHWILAVAVAAAFAALLSMEIAVQEEITVLEMLLEVSEILLTIGTAVGLAILIERVRAQHQERMALLQDLKITRAQSEEFRSQVQTHLDGLGSAIEQQFATWMLTGAEREVGVLMLKGFGHREIAVLRGTSEATIRQQARSIYQKSGVEGRPSFCAFFLEGLLPATPGAEKERARMTPSAPRPLSS